MTFHRLDGPNLKQPRAAKNPAYLAAVAAMPCWICYEHDLPQDGRSHAHHTICGRFSQHKTPDEQSIPLCWLHHQGPDGIHTRKEWWVASFGPDTDFIARTQDALRHLLQGQ